MRDRSERAIELPPAVAESGNSVAGASPRRRLALLCLTAIGIVYGDIGTSPLYAIRECFHGPHAIPPTPANVLGVLSLIFWTLLLVVTIKYVLYVLRADHDGEGGVLALMALATRIRKRRSWGLVVIGLFGAALLYGDGMITPAISVLSAIEGLEVVTPVFAPWVVPLTLAVLVGLFLFQRHGTGRVGLIFGPVVLVWFAVLAVLGVAAILREPSVLAALSPHHGFLFFQQNGWPGYLILGAVFLVATGGEALYADLGHFGRRPIQIDWFLIVAPALVLNYFGQGALLLRSPASATNPFYHLAPSWALVPVVILATMATSIASQAVISGVFSLTRQAVQLGLLPRVEIVHTSSREVGQIYIPLANWALMVATLALVVAFRSSSNLAAAYGVAVTTTMIITTLLAFVVARQVWGWPLWAAGSVTLAFVVGDLAFFGANIVKIGSGGWVPLAIAALVFALFAAWQRGQRLVSRELAGYELSIANLVREVRDGRLREVPGTVVYLTPRKEGIPPGLPHNIKHNRVIHERNVFMTVETLEVPLVRPEDRVSVENLGFGFHRVIARYGFMEEPDVPAALRMAAAQGLELDPMATTYILSRSDVISRSRGAFDRLRDALYAALRRNALDPARFFRLPPNRVMEIGMVLEVGRRRT